MTDAIIQRGEFLTSYTPYQAEITQGTLQAIFEFQTLMCQLTGQEVANASMWDGSTATTEAVLMAERLTCRRRVLVARSVHPEYRAVLTTYAKNSGLHVEEIPFAADGTLMRSETLQADVERRCRRGRRAIAEFLRRHRTGTRSSPTPCTHAGALLVVAITEGVSLGVVKPPAEADIVAMEGQSFGLRAQLWRPIRRRDRVARKICAPDARPPRGTNHRYRRAGAASCSPSPLASNTSAARKRLRTSARIRRFARWPPRSI